MVSMEQPHSLDHLLAQVSRLHHARGHKAFAELGLHRGQPPLLRLLWQEEGRTHSELADLLHVAPATITKMIQRMEKAGFVERRADPDDQRVSRVHLTDGGRGLHEHLSALTQRLDGETFDGFSEDERAALYSLLMRVRENLIKAQDAGGS